MDSKQSPDSKNKKNAPTAKPPEVTTTKRIGKFFIVGIILAIFNFALYTIIARIFNNNETLWLTSIIATTFTAILAYVLHSRITWRERAPSKTGVTNFILWNILLTIAITPFFTWFFGLAKFLYEFTYNISSAIYLPFDYAFVESTGIFILVNIVIMILNYLFYDRLVFGKPKSTKSIK